MGIIYGFGSVAGEVKAMLEGSLTANSTERIKSLRFFQDAANDLGIAAGPIEGSLYAIAIVEKDDKYHGRNQFFYATGSDFTHFQVELNNAFDHGYGVSEIAIVALGSKDNGSLTSLEAIGVTTGEQGNSSAIYAGSANYSNVGVAMGSITSQLTDNSILTTADYTTLGSTDDGADISIVKSIYVVAFTTTKP